MGADTTGLRPGANPDIAPYNTGLSGVNQVMNMVLKDALWWTLGVFLLVLLVIRIFTIGWSWVRLTSAMSLPGGKQGYWKYAQWEWTATFKRSLIYAPLFNKRHNREFRLSKATNIGTLPSRLHSVILGIYVLSNMVYMVLLNWNNENKWAFCAELRGRSGTLAAVNMVPLIILAMRNNPLIPMLHVSFDTMNLFHRWIGKLVVFEAVVHTIAWAIVQVADAGWDSVWDKMLHNTFIASGTAGTLAMCVLFCISLSPVRHAFYETFLNLHISLGILAFALTLVHCVAAELPGGLPQTPWMIAVLTIWGLERFIRFTRILYTNIGRGTRTVAELEPMPGETIRVTVHLPRYVDIKPGSHAYLRFAGCKVWESHPFSVAWVEHETESDSLLPVSERQRSSSPSSGSSSSSLSAASGGLTTSRFERRVATKACFVIGAQTGMTRRLYERAWKGEGKPVKVSAWLEGPYAGHHSLDSYGHCVLIAGSTGITHQISYIRHLIQGYNDGTVATRRLTLVWVVREYESLQWIRPWMDEILRLPNRKDVLNIRLFVTRPKNSREIVSMSTTVQMFPGRPNLQMLLAKEVDCQVGAMAVSVCGPGALADDVRQAVRIMQRRETVIDFLEESFTW